jgi:hypothetical protein
MAKKDFVKASAVSLKPLQGKMAKKRFRKGFRGLIGRFHGLIETVDAPSAVSVKLQELLLLYKIFNIASAVSAVSIISANTKSFLKLL